MRCSKAREFISDALDARLDERTGLDLSLHLDDCPDCRTHQQVLTDGQALLRQEVVQPSENFDWKVQLKIQQALREKAAGPDAVSGWAFWRPALASATAVALVVLVGGGLMLAPRWTNSPVPSDASGTAGFAVARSAPESGTTAQPDLSGGVRRQPLRINTASGGFGIRTVADQTFVNRSPFPDPLEEQVRWRQEGNGGVLELRRVEGPDGQVYFLVHTVVPRSGASLKLEPQRSTLQEALPTLPVSDSRQDPDS